MTTEIIERNLFVRDADGAWYVIPSKLEKEFNSLREEMFEMDTCSEEYFESRLQLEENFSQYLKD